MDCSKVEVFNKSIGDMQDGNNTNNDISDLDMELINKYTRKKFEKDDVYVFSVVLCDNDIDRQNESFSDESLNKFAKLFLGKTGIMDHNTVSENQTARIFSCEVREFTGKVNATGKEYKQLVAKAYMPRTEKNKEFITLIDSGIKKEVSISCTVGEVTCSICGSNVKKEYCRHEKGKKYKKSGKDESCYHILDDPLDAYEWSFVVVPAQRKAGVIKSFVPINDGGESKMEDIVKELGFKDKELNLGESLNLSKSDSEKIYDVIKELKEKARIGEEYLMELKDEVLRLSAIAQPEIGVDVMKSIVNKMSIKELRSFEEAYKKRIFKGGPIKPQLSRESNKSKLNTQFKI